MQAPNEGLMIVYISRIVVVSSVNQAPLITSILYYIVAWRQSTADYIDFMYLSGAIPYIQ